MAETWLHIGSDTTDIGQKPPLVLGIGRETIARKHFRHDPPAPVELENAIAAVEDEIAKVHKSIEGDSRLYTHDAVVRDIALDIGVTPAAEMELALEAVEHALGRLPSRATGKEKAAALVILRELMHHLGFSAVVVRTA